MYFITARKKTDGLDHVKSTVAIWKDKLEAGGVKNAEAYNENLHGIEQDLSSPSANQLFLEVANDARTTVLVAKAWGPKNSVDLSEIVKYWDAPKGPVEALVGWAATRYTKVTLTAAYALLVPIYADYGFKAEDEPMTGLNYRRWLNYRVLLESKIPRPQIIAEMRQDIKAEKNKEFADDKTLLNYVKEQVTELGGVKVNLPMTLAQKGAENARRDWKEGVYWTEVKGQAHAVGKGI